MAALHTPAHVDASPCSSSTFPRTPPSPKLAARTSRKRFPRVRFALSPPKWRESRRLVSFSLILSQLLFLPNYAIAGSFLDKYVKKKKLDPLEVYIPPVILTQLQIKDLGIFFSFNTYNTPAPPVPNELNPILMLACGKISVEKALEVEKPEYANCRSQLRSGPAASLRVNIRAVAQYASDAGKGKTAIDDVDQCLRALEDLDYMLLRASRNEGQTSFELMKAKIGTALTALDSLLQTVPSDVFNKGKAIADAYRMADEDVEPAVVDPEIKQLESIL